MADTVTSAAATRTALLDAGLHLFGHRGFAATSTREIAARAGANVASIAYHFGGKAGLHLACAEEVGRRLAAVAGPPADPGPLDPAEAQARLERIVRAMVTFLVTGAGAEDVVAFVLREVSAGPGPAVDRLYSGMAEPKHREICALWAAATGRGAEEPATKLAVFSLIGQVAYFRIARPVVWRRMGWDSAGPAEAQAIADVVVGNLRAALERSRT